MIFDNKKWIVFLICLGNIAISFNTGAVAAAIPEISHDLLRPELEVAKIVSFYMIPYGIGALIYAVLTKFFTYRQCAISAMLVYAVSCIVCAFSHSLNQILVAQIFTGVAAASSTPLSLMIIGEFFEKNIRGRLVGIYFGCAFFASMVGMIVMGTMHWRYLFMIPAVIAIVNIVCLWFLKVPELNTRHSEQVDYIESFKRKDIQRAFVFIFIMSFLYHALTKWYGVYLHQEYGLEKSVVSVILIIAAMCGLAGQQIGGYLSDKKGRMSACYVGMIGLAGGAMLLVGHYAVWFVAGILSLIAVSWTVNHNSVSTILTDFPNEDRPVIASLNSAVRFFSGGLGFSLSRVFVEKSFACTFLGIGICFFVMMFGLKKVFPKHV